MKLLFLLLIPFVTMSQGDHMKYHYRGVIGTHPALGWHKLTWSDFKGKPTVSWAAAVTNSGAIYETHCLGNACSITSVSVFYPDSSFSVTNDPYILVHEQGHFDITEIFTRLFQQEMESWQGCSEKKADEVWEVAEHYGRMREAMQQQYDRETNRSLDHVAQERWNTWIKEQLIKTDVTTR